MKIIDAHMHICSVIAGYCRRGELRSIGNGKVKWANGDVMELFPEGYGDVNFTAESAIRMFDEHNVEAGVILQGSMYGFQNLYIEEMLKQYPDRFRGACTVDPFAKNAEDTLEGLMQWTNIVKFEVSSGGGLMGVHQDFLLDGNEMDKLYSIIASKNGTLVIDFGSYTMRSYQPAAMARVAEKYKHMNVVICHLTAPIPGQLNRVVSALETLNLSNIWFDIAALPKIASPEKYPYPTAQEALKIGKKIVGANKLMFGTDLPFTAVEDDYQKLIDYITEDDIFNTKELEDLFYNNAKEVYFNV